MSGRRRIALVEDDPSVRESLGILLETWGFAVESYGDGESFLAANGAEGAECVLLDIRLPGRDGLSVLDELRVREDAPPVIILTGHGDVATAVRALRAGAFDFVEKPFDGDELVRRIDGASRLRRAREAEQAADLAPFARLTPREAEVLRGVIAGWSSKEVARRLGVSPKTVEVHRARIMEKTGAGSVSALARLAERAGIEPAPPWPTLRRARSESRIRESP